jgi:hypothetical protein
METIDTTLTTGTDNQSFCYNEQNQLTAAASVASGPCPPFIAGTLTAAYYSQSFTHDTMGRLTSGALGTYTHGNSAHVDVNRKVQGSNPCSGANFEFESIPKSRGPCCVHPLYILCTSI